MSDGHTISLPPCLKCPPLGEWPARSLILGGCPLCSRRAPDDKIARELRARQIIRDREASS